MKVNSRTQRGNQLVIYKYNPQAAAAGSDRDLFIDRNVSFSAKTALSQRGSNSYCRVCSLRTFLNCVHVDHTLYVRIIKMDFPEMTEYSLFQHKADIVQSIP